MQQRRRNRRQMWKYDDKHLLQKHGIGNFYVNAARILFERYLARGDDEDEARRRIFECRDSEDDGYDDSFKLRDQPQLMQRR